MIEWYNALSGFSKSMFILGMVMGVFLIIQVIMLIAGMGDDLDIDVDAADVDINDTSFGELAGLKILSIRTVVIFLCIGAWVAFILDTADCHIALSIIIGILAGALAAFLFAFAMSKAMKLQGEGNIDYSNAVGKEAEVYLTIPKDENRYGKITLVVQERMIEMLATSDEEIKTGERVVIVSVENNVATVRRK